MITQLVLKIEGKIFGKTNIICRLYVLFKSAESLVIKKKTSYTRDNYTRNIIKPIYSEKVYGWSIFKKKLWLKVLYFYEISFFKSWKPTELCSSEFFNVYNENMFIIEVENGRERPKSLVWVKTAWCFFTVNLYLIWNSYNYSTKLFRSWILQ